MNLTLIRVEVIWNIKYLNHNRLSRLSLRIIVLVFGGIVTKFEEISKM